jgi:hypothetical protein
MICIITSLYCSHNCILIILCCPSIFIGQFSHTIVTMFRYSLTIIDTSSFARDSVTPVLHYRTLYVQYTVNDLSVGAVLASCVLRLYPNTEHCTVYSTRRVHTKHQIHPRVIGHHVITRRRNRTSTVRCIDSTNSNNQKRSKSKNKGQLQTGTTVRFESS